MKNRRGFTLIEALVAASMFGLLTSMVIGSWIMLNRHTRTQLTRIEARQQLRTTMALLRAEIQSAYLVYDGYSSTSCPPGTFGGTAYDVVTANNVVVGKSAGKDLLYAIPESSEGNPTWKVCGLQLVDNPPSGGNVTQDLIEEIAEAGTAINSDPILLAPQFASLNYDSKRDFKLNIVNGYFILHSPAASKGLARTYCVAPAPMSVFMHLDFLVKPEALASTAGYTMSETYETEVFLRNQPPATPP